MPRRSMLLLVAIALTGGCSPDGPLVAPAPETMETLAVPLVPAAAGDAVIAAAIDDALTRLVPALDSWGVPVGEALLRLQARRNDKTAKAELQRALDAVALVLPAEYRPDFDALRLELDVVAAK